LDEGQWLSPEKSVGVYERFPFIRRITPYAWMWQLGSERIVGKSEVTVEQASLTRTKGRSLILAADGRRGIVERS
jgi:hypothetical protein